MNHLVYLDTQAGELEKILSGTKSMVVKEFYPAQSVGQAVSPGDSLYFFRNNDECILRVIATVVGVLFLTNNTDEDLSYSLKELQPRLQLTEEQFNYWSAKKTVELVEFKCAQKIGMIQVAAHKIADRSGWVAFEELSQIM